MASKFGRIAALGIVLIGIPAVFGYAWLKPHLVAQQQVSTSDAVNAKGTISIGTDNFIGYYPYCSPYLKSLMRAEGYNLKCDEDKAEYASRMDKLAKGEIQFAVATVDSYELNAIATNFPGEIIMIGDESHGADAIVSCRSAIKNIDDLKKPGLKFAFTPSSPSEYLLKANAMKFEVPQLRNPKDKSWRVETEGGSPEAAQKCKDGVVDVAVLWEPDVSKLLRSDPSATKLMGTESTYRLVVDILLVRREFKTQHPEVVEMLLRNYFKTLYFYRNNADVAAAHAAAYAGLKADEVQSAMQGVHWVNLSENALLWFGVEEGPNVPRQYGLLDVIESTTQILVDSGDFQKSPLKDGDPRTIVWSGFIEKLYQSGMSAGEAAVDLKQGNSLARAFSELSDDQWSGLRQVGTLQVRPIQFQNGNQELSDAAKENSDRIAEVLKTYPDFRILIEGHTGTRGTPADNLELSQDRAEAVERYLHVTYFVDPNRMHVVGVGDTKPLKRDLGESDREYQARLARVVVKLMTEAY